MSTLNAADENVLAQKLERTSVNGVSLGKGCVSPIGTPTMSRSDDSEDETTISTLDPEHRSGEEIEPITIVYAEQVGAVEPVTGISFPTGLNQYQFIGCGVRTKFYVFHAYAVGLYLDGDVKNHKTSDLLLDPEHPKIFRLVMNMNITSAQYIDAIYDSLTPLMKGQDMDKLDELKDPDMPKMLNKGMEIFLMVKGNIFKMQMGDRACEIESIVLTRAVCEIYLGDKVVSPAMKKAAWKGLAKLQKSSK